MKFRSEREVLAEALSTAGRAATGRTGTLPVLSGLRLELRDDQLTITGTDLELTIQLTVTVGGDADGGVVVPAKLTSDIVRALPNGKVEFEVDGDDVRITGGRSQFSVRPLALDDYPRVASSDAGSVTLDAATLGAALRQVVRAASHDEARPVLTGVLLAAEDNGLRLVATDSYRLAMRDLPGVSVLGANQKVLVPGRALKELEKLIGGGPEVVLRLGERDATFEIGTTRLTTRLLEGEFPNYRVLIPNEQPNELTVARESLLESLRRVKIFATGNVPVRLRITADGLELSAVTQDVGNANEELDATATGTDLVIAFNAEYLIDGVEAVGTEMVTLSTRDATRAALVRGVGAEDYLYLLMPVRVP